MSTLPLFTRCAHCQTVFRITAPQLQARGVQVRCGRCLQVFDGLAGLQAEAPQSAAQSPGSQPDEIRADASPAEVLQADVLQPVAAQGDTVPAAGIAAEVAAEQPPVAVEDTPVSAVEDLQPVVENHDAVASSEPAAEAEKEWIEIQEAPGTPAVDAGDAAAEPVATTTEAKPDALIDEDNPFVPRPPVIEPRRREDTDLSLWTTFNVIQENVVRGGLQGRKRNAEGRIRRSQTRAINGIDQNVTLNRALWTLAEGMQRLKVG